MVARAVDRHARRALVRADGGARGPDGAQLQAQDQDEGVPQAGEGGVLKKEDNQNVQYEYCKWSTK